MSNRNHEKPVSYYQQERDREVKQIQEYQAKLQQQKLPNLYRNSINYDVKSESGKNSSSSSGSTG